MKEHEGNNPGFHAIMMASAYAEEGLAEAARLTLHKERRERVHVRRVVRESPALHERLQAPGTDR